MLPAMRSHIFLVSLIAVVSGCGPEDPARTAGASEGPRDLRSQDGVATPAPDTAPAGSRPAAGAKVTRGPVELGLAVTEAGGKKVAVLDVQVAPGHHLYAPGSEEGIPISVELAPGTGIEAAGKPQFPAAEGGHLSGAFRIEIPIKGDGSEVEVIFGFQACDEQLCYPPEKGVKVRARL
jgi:hypothetical protein